MDKLRKIEGELSARDLRIGIVAARFNELIVDSLVRGAVDALLRHGASEKDITLVRVPGAWEMPWAVKKMAASRRYDAIIALGAVIRGATPHFDYVAGECARGLTRVALDRGLPVVFGVLNTDTLEQALERAGRGEGNKGFDAAVTALQMVGLLDRVDAGPGS